MTASGVRPQALVTGATGGMGGEIVRELSRTHDVIAVGRSADALSELARQTGATPWVLDIPDAEALAARAAELTRLDVLVHGAAIAAVHTAESATPEDWERQFAINVFAPAELTRQVLPLLRESRVTVVFIGSGAGTRPVPGDHERVDAILELGRPVLVVFDDDHVLALLHEALGPLDGELGHVDVLLGGPVERAGHHHGGVVLQPPLHVGDLLGALGDEQDEEVHLGVVLLD